MACVSLPLYVKVLSKSNSSMPSGPGTRRLFRFCRPPPGSSFHSRCCADGDGRSATCTGPSDVQRGGGERSLLRRDVRRMNKSCVWPPSAPDDMRRAGRRNNSNRRLHRRQTQISALYLWHGYVAASARNQDGHASGPVGQ